VTCLQAQDSGVQQTPQLVIVAQLSCPAQPQVFCIVVVLFDGSEAEFKEGAVQPENIKVTRIISKLRILHLK